MLRPGDTLGDYEIVARIRAGGMATLYLGRRRGAAGFAKPVAIKLIHPHLAEDPAFVKMFVDEARLSAAIADPHVVHVEELAQHDGTLFLVMEYVDGCSLAHLMRALAARGRRMSPDLAVALAIQLADGLHAAHEATGDDGRPLGVDHRDVSPQNVLVSYRGHVKVIDFGIAKARTAGGAKTATGSLRGKIAYMSPEQAYGRAVDRRTDVYAAAIVLWEMLTQRRLFQAETELALLEHVRAPAVEPPSAHAAVSKELDDVVMAALAVDADARPATASDLRRRLAAAAPGALRIDAAEIAAFVGAVLRDDIAKSRAVLPGAMADALGAVATDTSSAADELVKTLSVDAGATTTIEFDDDPPPALAASTVVLAQPSTARRPTRPRSRSWVLALLAAAVVVPASVVAIAFALPMVRGAPSTTASGTTRDSVAPAPPVETTPSATASGASSAPESVASSPSARRPPRARPGAARATATATAPATATAISTFGTTPIAPKAPF